MSTERRFDVVVVGAGPGGCATAIELGRAGIAAVVVDRARFPRDKCCGDGLTTGALRRLEALGLETREVASFTALDELAVRSPSGRVARLPLGAGTGFYGATARRVDLDAALVRLARTHVEVREHDGFAQLSRSGDDLVVELDSGERLLGRTVVAADGAWSPVRRALTGAGEGVERAPRPSWYAYRAYAQEVAPRALERLWVGFDAALLPGYLWAFPVADAVNVGICCTRAEGERGAVLATRWDAALRDGFLTSLLGRRATLEGPGRAWPIPAGVAPGTLTAARGQVLFVGDAAQAGDPFTGEGIAQALETGALAARALADHRADARRAAADYVGAVLASLGTDHAIARALRRALAHPRGARAAVRAAGATRFTRREVGRWLYEDYPRSIALRPGLWRAATATQPPPYAIDSPADLGAG